MARTGPVAAPAHGRANPMADGHRAWLDGLVATASKEKVEVG
ncbi:hypothetical protein [Streptomyces sp. ME18-1-4]|nr:hypothetical protein [Streptomyces sp. ME18-1-4]MDX3244460.1 hypothetical protein [Streptomyces sp. ME18-1-4]